MRIRTHILVSTGIACLLAILVIVALVYMAREGRASLQDQMDANEVARDAASLLALTSDFALYGSDRSAKQWRTHHARVLDAVERAMQRRAQPIAELTELRRSIADVEALFTTVMAIGPRPATPLALRRRELLVERLLSATQEIVENRHRWALVVARAQRRDQEVFQAMAIVAPMALLLIVVSLAALFGRRVLPRLTRLQTALAAMRGGNLDARSPVEAQDELGDVAQAVNAMAEALQERQAALRASERRLRLVADNIPALVSHIDTDQRYLYANAHFRRVGAGDPDAMIGRTMREERGEELYALLAPYVERALRGETVQFETSRLLRGRPVHRQVSYVPDLDENGRTRGFFAVTFDITARKETELRLAASERRLLDLTNSIPAVVAYFDMQERCQYANDRALRLQGLERATAAGISLRDAIGEAEYAAHRHHVAEILAGRRVRFEGRSVRDGHEAHYQAHLIPDMESDGTQRGFYAMTFDITALKKAQQQQARVERQLREITDNLPVLISYLDQEERFQFANDTYRYWLGLDPEALVGRRFAEVVTDPEHYEQRSEHLRRALAGERVCFEVESVMLGVARSLQVVYIPDRQPDGSVAGVFTLSTDITPMKQVEARLSQLAGVDALTGLPNRRQFEDRIRAAIEDAAASGKPLAVMFIDVDHFKSINDRHGHVTGDLVLKEFASRLKQTARPTDLVARLAGDEFVVLLEGLHDQHDAEIVAMKMSEVMREPFSCAGTMLRVGASIGVAYCAYPHAEGDLLACADAALYEAKGAGRDTFRVRRLSSVVPAGAVTRDALPGEARLPGA